MPEEPARQAPLDAPAHTHWLRRALTLAAAGPVPDPNPRVGAVILDAAGQLVGEGYHRGRGTGHAETVALAQAGKRARGGTAYVTLEPCAHHGTTGPCAQALIDAGVARVIYAAGDPSDLATGGARRLTDAGIEVTGGPLADEAVALNPAWTVAASRGWPYVTWKFAATLDGRSAAADGTSAWITGPLARADVHRRRAQCGAIVVGTGTALADDPRLTVREPDGTLAPRQPLRVVVGHRELPAAARVLDAAAPTRCWRDHDLPALLRALYQEDGIRHVWLEGGPTLAAAFWRAGLVDEVLAYLAPALLGAGTPAVADLGIGTIADLARLDLLDVHRIGDDVLLRAGPRRAAEALTTSPTEGTTCSPE